MEPVLIDTQRTFGVELEGLIRTGGDHDELDTRQNGCECDCNYGCQGGCYGDCNCEEFQDDLLYEWDRENPKPDISPFPTVNHPTIIQWHMLRSIEWKTIRDTECLWCRGECDCPFCRGECDCDFCDGNCGCGVCSGRCESCLQEYREGVFGCQSRSGLANSIHSNCDCRCHHEDWNTRTVEYWKVIYDGSVEGDHDQESVEVISPPLAGLNGLKQVSNVVKQMSRYGVEVNSSAGLHVHHCSKGLSSKTFYNLLKFYAFYEGIIDSIMPKSRRGQYPDHLASLKHISNCESAKQFCLRLDDYCFSSSLEFRADESFDQRDNTIRELCSFLQNERYCKINITAYMKHGTIEFRHHSGTTDSKKVMAWVEFTQLIIVFCSNPHTSILDNHVPSFYKMMILLQARPELKDFYHDRRDFFNKQYGSLTSYCTNHKQGYHNE